MFFTKLGRIVATLAFTLGILEIALGLGFVTGVVVEPVPGGYLGSKTSGRWIDGGIYQVMFAIIIGVITDISRSVAEGNLERRD